MLSKKNLVLILDTNILKHVLSAHQSSNPVRLIRDWLASIVRRMSGNPKGKTVTVLVSAQVLKDYKTGLTRAGHDVAGRCFVENFPRLVSNRFPVTEGRTTYFTFLKLVTEESHCKLIRDRDDQKFLALINQALARRQLSDRFIIFATGDCPTGDGIEAALIGQQRVSVQRSIDELEKMIEC